MRTNQFTAGIIFFLQYLLTGVASPTTLEICFNKHRTISCEQGFVISIIDGYYGRTLNPPKCLKNFISRSCRDYNAVHYMKKYCQNQRQCVLYAYVSIYGDVCPFPWDEILSVTYECVPFSGGDNESLSTQSLDMATEAPAKPTEKQFPTKPDQDNFPSNLLIIAICCLLVVFVIFAILSHFGYKKITRKNNCCNQAQSRLFDKAYNISWPLDTVGNPTKGNSKNNHIFNGLLPARRQCNHHQELPLPTPRAKTTFTKTSHLQQEYASGYYEDVDGCLWPSLRPIQQNKARLKKSSMPKHFLDDNDHIYEYIMYKTYRETTSKTEHDTTQQL